SPATPVLIGWTDVSLDDNERTDLADLLSMLNYIGRSESWVRATIGAETEEYVWNCQPSGEDTHVTPTCDSVLVACALPQDVYESHIPKLKPRGKKTAAKSISWLDALGWSTAQLLDARRTE